MAGNKNQQGSQDETTFPTFFNLRDASQKAG